MAAMATLARPPKTIEDYLALPEDVRAELIRGELYVTPAPGDRHQTVLLNLAVALQSPVQKGGLGKLSIAPRDVYLPSGDVVQPDLLFLARHRASLSQEDAVHGAPDLVIEVVSPTGGERDRIVKRSLYARAGVGEYWLVDLEARGIEVLRLERGAWRPAGWYTGDGVVTSPVLPGVAVRLEDVFRDL